MNLFLASGDTPQVLAVAPPIAVVETPSTPSRRRRSSRSRTKSPSPTRVLQQEPPSLPPVSEEPAVEEEDSDDEPIQSPVQQKPSTPMKSPVAEVSSPADTPKKVEIVSTPKQETPVKGEEAKMEVDSESQPSADKMETDGEKAGDTKDDDKKRKRSNSPKQDQKKRQKLPPPNIDDFVAEEDEPELDNSKLQLSWFDSDLNLKINRDSFTEATNMTESALALVWAGCRANYGVKNNGKYFYEVALTSQHEKLHFNNEKRLHDLRCGWSVANTVDLQVGEFENSFGIDGAGKKCTNRQFTEYANRFGLNDIIGVHLVSLI